MILSLCFHLSFREITKLYLGTIGLASRFILEWFCSSFYIDNCVLFSNSYYSLMTNSRNVCDNKNTGKYARLEGKNLLYQFTKLIFQMGNIDV